MLLFTVCACVCVTIQAVEQLLGTELWFEREDVSAGICPPEEQLCLPHTSSLSCTHFLVWIPGCVTALSSSTFLLPDEVTHLGILIILYPVRSETEDMARDDTSLIKHGSLNPIMFYTPDSVTKLLCLQRLRCDRIHLQPLHVSFLVKRGASFKDQTTYTESCWVKVWKGVNRAHRIHTETTYCRFEQTSGRRRLVCRMGV